MMYSTGISKQNNKGATSTHLQVAPSKASPILLPPLGSITLIRGASCPLSGEVTCFDAPSLARRQTHKAVSPTPHALLRGSREAFLNLRNLFRVELTDDCRKQNALQQDFQRYAKIVGPIPQECPIGLLNISWDYFDFDVREFTLRVSACASIFRHGRFLVLNRIRSRLCKGWRVFIALASPLFLVGAATIETEVSLVNRKLSGHHPYFEGGILRK